jgi:hypothetical protein
VTNRKQHRKILKRGILLLLGWLSFSLVSALASDQAQPNSLDLQVDHKAFSGNLAQVLAFVATEFKVPLIAELVQPLPRKLSIKAGKSSARQELAKLVAVAKQYSFRDVDGVANVYSIDLRRERRSLLNLRFQTFDMPPNVGALQLTLPARLKDLADNRKTGAGFATSGFATLEKKSLHPERLTDISGSELLIKAAKERTFYSIIVCPTAHPPTDAEIRSTFDNWFWGGLGSTPAIFIQPPPNNHDSEVRHQPF